MNFYALGAPTESKRQQLTKSVHRLTLHVRRDAHSGLMLVAKNAFMDVWLLTEGTWTRCFTYGGDEFLVVLEEVSLHRAARVVERIGAYVLEWNQEEGLQAFELTLSICVSDWSCGIDSGPKCLTTPSEKCVED